MQNPLDLIRHGGFMMVPLLVSALLALTFIFEKLYYFKKVYSVSPSEFARIENEVATLSFQKDRSSSSGKISEKNNVPKMANMPSADHAPITSIFNAGSSSFDLPAPELEKLLERTAQTWIPVLEKRLEILDTIITAAPLMGLLGTITGMMASFQVLSTAGVNEPNAITGGVSEALIATATGLIIALISLIFYNYFNSKVKQTVEEMENLANLFLEQKMKLEKNS
jgi:biopolymer transport protein ExbB